MWGLIPGPEIVTRVIDSSPSEPPTCPPGYPVLTPPLVRLAQSLLMWGVGGECQSKQQDVGWRVMFCTFPGFWKRMFR